LWGGLGTCAVKNEASRLDGQLETQTLVRSNIMHARTPNWQRLAVIQVKGAIIRRFTPAQGLSGRLLATDKELNDFLRSVEKRAFKRSVYLVRDDDAALDIVQDAMMRLAEKYFDRPAAELPLLFQRILSNATMDWFRRQKVRRSLFQNMSDFESDDPQGEFDLLEALETADGSMGSLSAADEVSRAQILRAIDREVAELPARQREAFLLRYWEEMDTAETAAVMGCSEGSVKTHCSRAVHALAKALKSKGITL
jgi:RNA polymerase sigma-70 factor (ECF subfamily)